MMSWQRCKTSLYIYGSECERHKIVKFRARALAPRLQSVVGMNCIHSICIVPGAIKGPLGKVGY